MVTNFYVLKGDLKASKSGNEAVAVAISQWVFKEHGRLRVKSVLHHKAGEKAPPQDYTILDDVVSILW